MPRRSKQEIKEYVRSMNKYVVDMVTTLPNELVHEQAVNRITEYLEQEELYDELAGTSEQQDLDRITIHLYGFCEMMLEYNADAMQV